MDMVSLAKRSSCPKTGAKERWALKPEPELAKPREFNEHFTWKIIARDKIKTDLFNEEALNLLGCQLMSVCPRFQLPEGKRKTSQSKPFLF
jgi:hypothetical protein